MGKGDIKTRRGKLFAGTFGVRRPKKKKNKSVTRHHIKSDISAPKSKPERIEKKTEEVKEPIDIQKTEGPVTVPEEKDITVSGFSPIEPQQAQPEIRLEEKQVKTRESETKVKEDRSKDRESETKTEKREIRAEEAKTSAEKPEVKAEARKTKVKEPATKAEEAKTSVEKPEDKTHGPKMAAPPAKKTEKTVKKTKPKTASKKSAAKGK